MLALALTTLLAVVSPENVVVPRGETRRVVADFSPQMFLYGAGFYAEDPSIAEVTGSIAVKASSGTAQVRGLRVGETRLLLQFVSGFTVYNWTIGTIRVTPPCRAPTVTLDRHHARLTEGGSLTVSAMTTGTREVRVVWYDGPRLIGAGSPFVLQGLAAGLHRITAVVWNSCGSATSEELLVVVAPRRRAARQ